MFLRRRKYIGVLISGADEDLQQAAIREWAELEGVKISGWIKANKGEVPDVDKGVALIVYNYRILGDTPQEAYMIVKSLKDRGVKVIQAVESSGSREPTMGC